MPHLKRWIVVPTLVFCVLSTSVFSGTLDGMYYCTETASVGLVEGEPTVRSNGRLTVKIKADVVVVSGDSRFGKTFKVSDNATNVINHDTGRVFVQKRRFSSFSMKRMKRMSDIYRFESEWGFIMESAEVETGNGRHRYISEGTCEKW